MNIAIILASGMGQRMDSQIPKQFVEINHKPVLMYTIEKFLAYDEIDMMIVPLPSEQWIEFMQTHQTFINDKRIHFIVGGTTRNKSLLKAFKYLEQFNLKDDDNILTHDGVRMFVDSEIKKNLEALKVHDIVGTYLPAIDTVAISKDNTYIDNVPNRNEVLLAQTPQSFKYKYLKTLDVNQDTSDLITWLLQEHHQKVAIVLGSQTNFKITTEWDLFNATNLVFKTKN